jgi:hypothetical protein
VLSAARPVRWPAIVVKSAVAIDHPRRSSVHTRKTQSKDRLMVLGNFLGNNSRLALPNDPFSAPHPIGKRHVKPLVANQSDSEGHVSRAVVGLDRKGARRSECRLLP